MLIMINEVEEVNDYDLEDVDNDEKMDVDIASDTVGGHTDNDAESSSLR